MKKIFWMIALSVIIVSCSKVKKGEFLISGDAKGVTNGKAVLLNTQTDNGLSIVIDSTKVVDGKFEFKGKASDLRIATITIKDVQQAVPFVLETGEIDIEVDKDSIWKSKIGGTFNNDEFNEFNVSTNAIYKRKIDYQNKNMDIGLEAQQKNDTATMTRLNKEFNAIQKEETDFVANYPKNHPKAFLSVLILGNAFNSPDFNLEEVTKTFNSFDESIKKSKPGIKIAEKLKSIKDAKKGKTETKNAKAVVGLLAPDFSAKTPEGTVVSLKENLGKVTIIDFWASWCGPCRKENPNVVALYNELHSKGLNIVGVSLDKGLEEWKKAIEKDKITWVQISNLKYWDEPIAKLYNVEQIPSTFILDASGKIVAKDLTGAALKAKITELLAQ